MQLGGEAGFHCVPHCGSAACRRRADVASHVGSESHDSVSSEFGHSAISKGMLTRILCVMGAKPMPRKFCNWLCFSVIKILSIMRVLYFKYPKQYKDRFFFHPPKYHCEQLGKFLSLLPLSPAPCINFFF